MKQISANITGSLILNGIDITTTAQSSSIWSGSFSTRITDLELFSSSLDNTYATDAQLTSVSQSFSSSVSILSGSLEQRVTNTEVTSSNLTTASGSFSSRVTNTEATASSLVNASSSFSTRVTTNETNISNLQTASGSFSTRTTNLETASGSFSTRVTSNESNISALQTASGSFSTRITNAESSITSLNSKTGSYATTGSNTFVDSQYISATNNALGFASTASLYTDGGMRVTKDAYVSGTLYLNNLTVYGTSSIQYVTSSQLNVATNIITVNTNTPSVRFGGITVYDSGSLGHTGSLFWDSQNDKWIYSNPSGSNYDGGMLISGPRNSSGLGNEVGTTACALMMGQGGDHITSSAIFHYGNATCFYGNSHISSSGTACFQGNVIASRIGVGTPVPGQLIDVYKTENDAIIKVTTCAAGAYFAADSQGTDGYYGLILQNNGTDRWLIGGYATTDLTFSTARTGGSEWLRINRSNGLACFGSTVCAPTISFSCNANTGFTPLRICNPNPGSSAYSEAVFFNDTTNRAGLFYNSSTRTVDGGVCSFSMYNDSATGNIRLRSGGSIVLATGTPSATDRLTINTSGVACFSSNVCVGNSLVVGSTSVFGSDMFTYLNGGIFFSGGGSYNAGIFGRNNGCDLILQSGGVQRLNITSTGVACFSGQVCSTLLTSACLILAGSGYFPAKMITMGGAEFSRYNTHIGTKIIAGSQIAMALGTRSNNTDYEDTLLLYNGNVGIGNSAPLTKLTVNNAVAGAILPYVQGTGLSYNNEGISVAGSNTNNTNIGNGLTLYNNVASVGAYGPVVAWSSMTGNGAYNSTYAFITGIYGGQGGDGNWAIGDLIFGTAESYGAVERMRIRYNGRVGIGCTTPTAPLTIRCDSSSTASSIEIATCASNSYRYVSINAGNGISYCIPAGTSQSPFIEVQGGIPEFGGGSFRIRTGAIGGVSDKLTITQDGTACFASVICTPTISVGGITPRANLHAFGSSASASTILQTGSQNYVMFGKVIQSYLGAATNIPLFIACPGANNGLFVKIDVRGVNAVGNIAYTSTMYAFQFRIGGGLQATNVVTCPGVNLGGAGYSAGTLCWCNAASSAPVLIYNQNNNGYILEALDVYVTTRDSAEIYFCTNYVTCG